MSMYGIKCKKIRFINLVFVLISIFLLSGCMSKNIDSKSGYQQYDKEGFGKLYQVYCKENNKELLLEELTFFNEITSMDLSKDFNGQLFKNSKTYQTYLVYEQEIYKIGDGFGGMGVVDIKLWDYNKDGSEDIIYTYSLGSGIHRAHIGIFDIIEKKNIDVQIESSSEIKQLGMFSHELILERNGEKGFTVYKGSILMDNNSVLELKRGECIGEVIIKEGKPVFCIDKL